MAHATVFVVSVLRVCLQLIKNSTSITLCSENNQSSYIEVSVQVLPQLHSPVKCQATSVSDVGYVVSHDDIDASKSLMS